MADKAPYRVLINQSAGTAQQLGEERIKNIFNDNQLPTERIVFSSSNGFKDRIKEAIQDDVTVLVGGGDGTINTAARLFLNSSKGFGILPMGTMNLMALDLGLPTDLGEAAKAYKGEVLQTEIDAGFVNDTLFLCNAAVGTIPQASIFREEHRNEADIILMPRLTAFILDQLDLKNQKEFTLAFNQKQREKNLSSVVVSNNTFSNQDNIINNGFARKGLQEAELGIYTISPKNFWDRIRLLFLYQTGFWKKDSVIREYKTRKAVIRTGKKEESVAVDGEPITLETPLEFRIEPQSVPLLIPNSRL
jgi:diacylglycerol kinase family enzyme